jgi:UDP-glucuronate 4-epimerase
MATYLVTGAAGFIASKVCELLIAAGHRVVGIDSLNDAYDARLKAYRLVQLLDGAQDRAGSSANSVPIWMSRSLDNWVSLPRRQNTDGKFIFVAIDIVDIEALDALFTEFSFSGVFNLAARAGVRASLEKPEIFLSTNTLGTLNILKCMQRHGVKQQVLASTSSLYAGCQLPWSEDQPVNTPLSPYAASKKAAELFAYSYHRMHGVHTTVVRYFTVFGPAGRPDMSIFRFIKWIDQGAPVEVFGDGKQSRDFTYVDDIARGTILAARPLGFEVVNLGGGRAPVSLLDVIAGIERRLGKHATLVHRPFHTADILESRADISKAERLLGWQPTTGLDKGLEQTISWYLDNKSWLDEIQTPE